VPALPGIALAFMPVQPTLWMMTIPTFGQQILINQMMRGEPIDPLFVLVSAVSTILATLACIFIAIRLYQKERLLYNTK
jgi:sodium transport system permease protein